VNLYLHTISKHVKIDTRIYIKKTRKSEIVFFCFLDKENGGSEFHHSINAITMQHNPTFYIGTKSFGDIHCSKSRARALIMLISNSHMGDNQEITDCYNKISSGIYPDRVATHGAYLRAKTSADKIEEICREVFEKLMGITDEKDRPTQPEPVSRGRGNELRGARKTADIDKRNAEIDRPSLAPSNYHY